MEFIKSNDKNYGIEKALLGELEELGKYFSKDVSLRGTFDRSIQ